MIPKKIIPILEVPWYNSSKWVKFMEILIAILLIFIILCLIFIFYVCIYNKYQEYIIRINEAEATIDSTLRKRFDLITRMGTIIKTNTKVEHKVFEEITKLKSKKLTNFELDRKLTELLNCLYDLAEENPSILKNDSYQKMEKSIRDVDDQLTASKAYYNDIITSYNKLFRSFPSNIVGKLSNHSEKVFFEDEGVKTQTTEKKEEIRL